jgi:hypothetical protein
VEAAPGGYMVATTGHPAWCACVRCGLPRRAPGRPASGSSREPSDLLLTAVTGHPYKAVPTVTTVTSRARRGRGWARTEQAPLRELLRYHPPDRSDIDRRGCRD